VAKITQDLHLAVVVKVIKELAREEVNKKIKQEVKAD